MTHILKTLAPYWDAVERGEKNFEVRRDDRGFQKGDRLVLRRLDPDLIGAQMEIVAGYDPPLYREIAKTINYVLTGGQLGIEPGYVVLGLEPW